MGATNREMAAAPGFAMRQVAAAARASSRPYPEAEEGVHWFGPMRRPQAAAAAPRSLRVEAVGLTLPEEGAALSLLPGEVKDRERAAMPPHPWRATAAVRETTTSAVPLARRRRALAGVTFPPAAVVVVVQRHPHLRRMGLPAGGHQAPGMALPFLRLARVLAEQVTQVASSDALAPHLSGLGAVVEHSFRRGHSMPKDPWGEEAAAELGGLPGRLLVAAAVPRTSEGAAVVPLTWRVAVGVVPRTSMVAAAALRTSEGAAAGPLRWWVAVGAAPRTSMAAGGEGQQTSEKGRA